MKVIYGGRQSGRTLRLIEMCAESEAEGKISYIVCHSQEEAYRIAQMAKRLKLFIGFPITYAEFVGRAYDAFTVKCFFIDNVDYLLQYISHVPIKAVTIETETS